MGEDWWNHLRRLCKEAIILYFSGFSVRRLMNYDYVFVPDISHIFKSIHSVASSDVLYACHVNALGPWG